MQYSKVQKYSFKYFLIILIFTELWKSSAYETNHPITSQIIEEIAKKEAEELEQHRKKKYNESKRNSSQTKESEMTIEDNENDDYDNFVS